MKFKEVEIKNYKGIEHTSFQLLNSPKNNVYTLVGINESGKTSILEAINSFEYNAEKGSNAISNVIKPDFSEIIPIKDKANFNGNIELIITLELEEKDYSSFITWAKENCQFIITNKINEIKITQKYTYKDSKYEGKSNLWDLTILGKKVGVKSKKENNIDEENWLKCVDYLKTLMPNILYFPTALFDLPDKIYLNKAKENEKESFYKAVIQDILDSLQQDMNIKTHIIDRFLSKDSSDKENVKQLSLKMGRKISQVILQEWTKVLSKKHYEVSVDIDQDSTGVYLQFIIVDEDGNFKLSERSLGFRWFFVFLLLTQFRGYRKNEDKEVIFLFDEPAANLSQKAQRQLLKSLENISKKCTIIYTTHSQYLINPNWLENAFVVTNEALINEEQDFYNPKYTNIKLEKYRSFVNSNPQQVSYFQPILDVLEYVPSELEICKSGIILEGKNDYYTLNYFFKVILEEKELQLIPGMNCTNSDTLISLYSGWGKDFWVLLDSDEAGEEGKKRYKKIFGPLINNRLYTFSDIDSNWKKKNMESILSNSEKFKIQQYIFPDSKKYTKNMYNKAVQELLMTNHKVEVSTEVKENFIKIYKFLNNLTKNTN